MVEIKFCDANIYKRQTDPNLRQLVINFCSMIDILLLMASWLFFVNFL